MTYKGDTVIGSPTLAMIEIHIAEKGLFCEPQEVFDYWSAKNWLTSKKVEVKTLEAAIDSYNSIAVQRATKKVAKKLGITKHNKKVKKSELKALRNTIASGNKCFDDMVKLESLDANKERQNKKTTKVFMPYDEQIHDARWKAFRTFIFAVRGKKCEICGCTDRLQVHHPKYKSGKLAWEYTCNEVMVVCRTCHEKIHHIVGE